MYCRCSRSAQYIASIGRNCKHEVYVVILTWLTFSIVEDMDDDDLISTCLAIKRMCLVNTVSRRYLYIWIKGGRYRIEFGFRTKLT